jgi:biopolymer transport protein ExbD
VVEIARRGRRAKEMDLTPLIDIVFQLVIFFMLTTTFVASESLELSLPSKGAGAPLGSEMLRIEIRSNGSVQLNQASMSSAQLEEMLFNRIGANPEVKIGIFSTPGVSVQQLVSVMDIVYLAGGKHVKVDRIAYE